MAMLNDEAILRGSKELEHRSDCGVRSKADSKTQGEARHRRGAPSVTINRSVIIRINHLLVAHRPTKLYEPCRSPTNSPLLTSISKTSAFLFALTSTSLCRMERSQILLYVPHRLGSLSACLEAHFLQAYRRCSSHHQICAG